MSVTPTSQADDRRRTRRFAWCVRLSVFVVLALEVLLLQVRVVEEMSPLLLAAVTASVLVHVATNVNLVNRTLTAAATAYPVRTLPAVPVIASAAGWLLVTVSWASALGVAAIPVSAFALAMSWAAVSVGMRWWVMLLGVLGVAIAFVVGLIITLGGQIRLISGLGAGAVAYAAFIVGGVWLSGWMLRVYSELDRARSDSARLAVAEERLRISRDLHDVFGRTMAAVAVKSELAAELARRGRNTEAADEIGQVRVIADDAGREMRRVIRGYRAADLSVELAGARSLLSAAGISCAVRGEVPVDLDPEITSVLAWVIRESVTNLIKHSDATRVDIDVDAGEDLSMIISNDGVPPRDDERRGHGLIGMNERVASVGGVLEHRHERDRFVVAARIPVRRPASALDRRT